MEIRKIVITRPSGPYAGGRRLAERLNEVGLLSFELPLLECRAIALSDHDRRLAKEGLGASAGSWLAFLSPTAVWVWRELIQSDQELIELTARARLAAQGSGTSAALVECFGRAADFTPSVFVAEEFAREFAVRSKKGECVLVPQSADGRDLLAPTLRASGVDAVAISTYRLEQARISEEQLENYRAFIDDGTALVFMSPSAVRAGVALIGGDLARLRLVSVGPITSQAIKSAGHTVWREAHEHSEEGIIKALSEPEFRGGED
jgi:uroporphyrinogen III methyltransferase/synthase